MLDTSRYMAKLLQYMYVHDTRILNTWCNVCTASLICTEAKGLVSSFFSLQAFLWHDTQTITEPLPRFTSLLTIAIHVLSDII